MTRVTAPDAHPHSDRMLTHASLWEDQKRNIVLALVLFAYLAIATCHALTAPTGLTYYQDAPDEVAHVNFVRTLATGKLPSREHPTIDNPTNSAESNQVNAYEWHQPPLYYALVAPLAGLGDRGMRFVSVFIGLIGLWLIYIAGLFVFPEDKNIALLAVGIAALTASHTAILSAVNNDGLLEVCFSWAVLCAFSALNRGFDRRHAIWLGAAIGLAILTKATGVLLIPLALMLIYPLVLLGRVTRGKTGDTGAKGTEKAAKAGDDGGITRASTIVKNFAITALIVAVLDGWWFARNMRLYGEPFPLRAFQAAFLGTRSAASVVSQVGGWGRYYLGLGQGTFYSFWAVFGRPEHTPQGIPHFLPDQVYMLIGLICLVVVVSLSRLHFVGKTQLTQSQIYSIRTMIVTFAVVMAAFLAFTSKYFQMQGRYLYPAMLPICLLMALGWRTAFPARYRQLATYGLLGILSLISAVYLMSITA